MNQNAVKEDKLIVCWYAYEDMLAIRDYIRTGQLSALQVVNSLYKKRAPSNWSWS